MIKFLPKYHAPWRTLYILPFATQDFDAAVTRVRPLLISSYVIPPKADVKPEVATLGSRTSRCHTLN